jgi:hypothetical protein
MPGIRSSHSHILPSTYIKIIAALVGLTIACAAQSVTITSPAPNSTSPSAVLITSSATGWSSSDHLEVWDSVPGLGGTKLGNVPSSSESAVYVLPSGSHTTTVNLVVNSTGQILAGNSVTYTVAESCTTSSTAQCNMDQLGIDNTQNDCNPPIEDLWVANPCGSGVQGSGGTDPTSTNIVAVTESSPYSDTGLTLNGQSLHLSETQGSGGYSNVLFKANAPTSNWTTSTQSNWTLDAYVYLPNPNAHQAFEIDAQYVSNNGVWTKFYTECAFNQSSGTGFWEVYGGPGFPWVNLNGKTVTINGQPVTPPNVPCNRSQFALPWSGGPSMTGWHHIVWTFKRNSNSNGDGYPTFVSLQFDGQTTTLNFTPTTQNSGTGEGDKGDFAALVQLDGVSNPNPPNNYPTVDVYVNEFNILHTP